MAGRPRAENPRTRLVGVRVTDGQGEVLDALAALDKTSVSEIARQSLLRTISAALQDECATWSSSSDATRSARAPTSCP